MILKFRTGFRITPVLLSLNLLVFLAVVVVNGNFSQFSAQSLLALGANYSNFVAQGEFRLQEYNLRHLPPRPRDHKTEGRFCGSNRVDYQLSFALTRP